jgi:hypothetical protein
MIQEDKFYRPKECLPVMGIGKTTFYYLIQIGALPSLEYPYPGRRVSGYWGRTLRSALMSLQTPTAPPCSNDGIKDSAG